MGPKKKTPLPAKQTKVTCRYCGIGTPQITRQYYPEHLIHIHNDNSGNLREFGQTSLTFGLINNNNGKETVSKETRRKSCSRSRSNDRFPSRSRKRSRSQSRERSKSSSRHRSSRKRNRSTSRCYSPLNEEAPKERSCSLGSRSSTDENKTKRSDLSPAGRDGSLGEEEESVKQHIRNLQTENERLREGQSLVLPRLEGLSGKCAYFTK